MINYFGQLVDFSQALVMGILNITHDSFFSESCICSEKELLARAEKMLTDGADILDIGAVSTRPGINKIISEEEEIEILSTAVDVIKKHFPQTMISIDTFRANVARNIVKNFGKIIINDISGGSFDDKMFETLAQLKTPYILTHLQGNLETMHLQTNYTHLLTDILHFFSVQLQKLSLLGVSDVIIDPGFGFSKTIAQNYELLQKLSYLQVFEKPILVGLSRKSMLYKALNTTPENALNATTAANALALAGGASILRVHDVKEAKELITIFAETFKKI